MTLEQLRYFMMLGRWEHVGRAARAAAISPSALSTSISQLESELGRKLFDRIGRNIRINAAGRTLMPKAHAILHDVQSLRLGDDASAPAGFQGLVRIGASPLLA